MHHLKAKKQSAALNLNMRLHQRTTHYLLVYENITHEYMFSKIATLLLLYRGLSGTQSEDRINLVRSRRGSLSGKFITEQMIREIIEEFWWLFHENPHNIQTHIQHEDDNPDYMETDFQYVKEQWRIRQWRYNPYISPFEKIHGVLIIEFTATDYYHNIFEKEITSFIETMSTTIQSCIKKEY